MPLNRVFMRDLFWYVSLHWQVQGSCSWLLRRVSCSADCKTFRLFAYFCGRHTISFVLFLHPCSTLNNKNLVYSFFVTLYCSDWCKCSIDVKKDLRRCRCTDWTGLQHNGCVQSCSRCRTMQFEDKFPWILRWYSDNNRYLCLTVSRNHASSWSHHNVASWTFFNLWRWCHCVVCEKYW